MGRWFERVSSPGWGRVGLGALVLLVGLYLVAVCTVPGQWLDDEVFGLAQRMPPWPVRQIATPLARRILPPVLLLFFVTLVGWACLRRRWVDLVVAVTIPLVCVPSARWLRIALPRPDHGYSYDANTMPSTHVALVAALVVAAGLLWPSARGIGVTLMGVLVVWLACLGNVIGYAHRPSDAVASVLLVVVVASGVMLVRQSATRFIRRRTATPRRGQ